MRSIVMRRSEKMQSDSMHFKGDVVFERRWTRHDLEIEMRNESAVSPTSQLVVCQL